MNDQVVIDLGLSSLMIAAKLSAPMLLTALVVGFVISLLQSITQIQEVTLSFVPKALAVGIVMVIAGNWMLHEMVSFTTGLYGRIPDLVTLR